MSRSVSTHRNAVATVYLQSDHEYPDEQYAFDEFVEDVVNVVQERYPSFTSCDRWNGDENHVILENGAAEVSVSNYCGLNAVCLAPIEPSYDFYDSEQVAARNINWTNRIANRWHEHMTSRFRHSALVSRGFASNGEQFFMRVDLEKVAGVEPGSCVTSKEGTLF